MVTVLSVLSRCVRSGHESPVTLWVMPSTGPNPLLRVEFLIPFDSITAEHVEPAIAELLRDARAGLAQLAADGGERTYDNTMQRLDEFTEPLDQAMGVVSQLASVATNPPLRAAFNA